MDKWSLGSHQKAAKAMTKGNVYGYTYALGQPRFAWREGPYIAGYSNDVDLSDTGDAAKPKYLEVLRLFKDLYPSMSPSTKVMGLRDAMQAWALGNVAMFATGDYVVATGETHSVRESARKPSPVSVSTGRTS
jgi:predicted heme/steroid binding protein